MAGPEEAAALTPGDLAELRELLVAESRRARAQIASLTGAFDDIVGAADHTATDDEHDPEGSTIALERSQTSALLVSTRAHLADVDLALTRIDEGAYGVCESCGQPIARERLLARPASRTCVACAARAQRRR
ncbi:MULTISPECIES: TraR/DksA family transcriptional regulator [unclassified Microbacterium]|uniref:TraR/DksA family transcriptional regulator n=1 Tax=Microbacterium TaxID=33882 RepID=UPI003BA3BD1E